MTRLCIPLINKNTSNGYSEDSIDVFQVYNSEIAYECSYEEKIIH